MEESRVFGSPLGKPSKERVVWTLKAGISNRWKNREERASKANGAQKVIQPPTETAGEQTQTWSVSSLLEVPLPLPCGSLGGGGHSSKSYFLEPLFVCYKERSAFKVGVSNICETPTLSQGGAF